METRTLGNDLKVSAIGLGCMGLTMAYGKPLDHDAAVELIRKAYDAGCNFFDTAEIYQAKDDNGTINYNETLLGGALKDVRDNVIIATKFGITAGEGGAGKAVIPDASPESIRKSVEASLKRLNTDHIDLYYQHRIDPSISPEMVAQTMKELIDEGKITHWGISEATADYLRRANAVCKVTAVQNRYSMMYRKYEDLFPVLEELNIGFVSFSPLANGFLSGNISNNNQVAGLRSRMPQFTPEAIKKNQDLLNLLNEIAAKYDATPAQISLAWMINKKPFIVPIPGSRHLNRVLANLNAADIKISAKEIESIDSALDTMPMSAVFGGTKVADK